MTKLDFQVDVPLREALSAAIDACLANGSRLIRDTYQLEFEKPPASRLILAMAAQEEFAKAFILFLVREGSIGWSRYLLRAINDHSCKQLIGAAIEYIYPVFDETYEELVERVRIEYELGENLPTAVADAISILRHEKIGRWHSQRWEWAEPPNWDAGALKIAKGARDRIKQDALYVRIGRDASVVSSPQSVSEASSDEELVRAEAYQRFLRQLLERGDYPSKEYTKIKDFIFLLFSQEDRLSFGSPDTAV